MSSKNIATEWLYCRVRVEQRDEARSLVLSVDEEGMDVHQRIPLTERQVDELAGLWGYES